MLPGCLQDMPGKYYSTNHTADRVQNWLTLQPDSVLPAVHASPWILKMWLLKVVAATQPALCLRLAVTGALTAPVTTCDRS